MTAVNTLLWTRHQNLPREDARAGLAERMCCTLTHRAQTGYRVPSKGQLIFGLLAHGEDIANRSSNPSLERVTGVGPDHVIHKNSPCQINVPWCSDALSTFPCCRKEPDLSINRQELETHLFVIIWTGNQRSFSWEALITPGFKFHKLFSLSALLRYATSPRQQPGRGTNTWASWRFSPSA